MQKKLFSKLFLNLFQLFFRFAAEKYRKGLVKCEVLGLASKDLQCYASAFDSVFIGVHQWRMKQINEIIKKLWQETYRGQGK